MRDPHRTRDYFLQRIEVETKSIARREEKLIQGSSRNPDTVVGGITNSHIEIAKCLFCLGEPIERLYDPVYEAITVASKHDFAAILGSEYPTLLDMSSLAILLDLDQSWFDKLATIVGDVLGSMVNWAGRHAVSDAYRPAGLDAHAIQGVAVTCKVLDADSVLQPTC